MPKPIAESAPLSEATTSTDKEAGLLDVVFLTEGWGSSGYYSREVVESAAPLFAAGTHVYFDHPTDVEAIERPGRSVRDLCAVIKEGGAFDAELGGVRGKVKPFAPYRDLLLDEDFALNVGMSIRGSASDIVQGKAAGRSGRIVEGLADIQSVDFVTRAGRGGRVLSVLESARPEQVVERAVGRGVEEATADERRQQLSDAVRATYGSDTVSAWVRDFDETTVWFETYADDEPSQTWEQPYTAADDDLSVELTGTRAKKRAVTRYVDDTTPTTVPVTRPGSTTTTATESEEDTMPKIQIEESEHNRLTETAGRVDALESENATLKATVTSLQEADQRRTREDRARAIVAEKATAAKVEFTDLEVVGLVASAPVKEDGTLDEDAFATTVDAQVETRKTAATESASTVHGFGASAAAASAGVAESGQRTSNPWGRPLTEQKGA